jgi:hypothetical protein
MGTGGGGGSGAGIVGADAVVGSDNLIADQRHLHDSIFEELKVEHLRGRGRCPGGRGVSVGASVWIRGVNC